MNDAPQPVTYARRLGVFSATMMVVGGIVGAGIFLNPAVVAARVPTVPLTLLAWGLGAVIALIGAFIFAELAHRRPKAGGGYAYLREAFGPLVGFLYAWALLLVIATGAIAAVAMTFAGYAAALMGWPPTVLPWLAGGAIVVPTIINIVGVRPGAWTQNALTVLKLLAIAALVIAVFATRWHPVAAAAPPALKGGVVLALGAALVPVLFAYGGWQQTNFVAEELVHPERDLPRALVLGVLLVVVAYLTVNLAYLKALGVGGLAASTAPAADTMAVLAGDAGRRAMAAGIVVSTFGWLNLVILVTPRVYQAMARDGLFFAAIARLDPRWRTPVNGLVLQALLAILLLATKTYGQLLDYVVFGDWIFFALAAASVFVLRRRDGAAPIPFRIPFHPWTTSAFILAAAYVVIGSIASNPGNALRGALLLLAGVPVFLVWRALAPVT